MDVRSYQFEWDGAKAGANARKHGITFEMAATVFGDPSLLTIADLVHGTNDERWFSVGIAGNGTLLAVSYIWGMHDPTVVKIRLISARAATSAERRQYAEGL